MFTKLILLSGIILIGNAMAGSSDGHPPSSSPSLPVDASLYLSATSGAASPTIIAANARAVDIGTQTGTTDEGRQPDPELTVTGGMEHDTSMHYGSTILSDEDTAEISAAAEAVIAMLNNDSWDALTQGAIKSILKRISKEFSSEQLQHHIDTVNDWEGCSDLSRMLQKFRESKFLSWFDTNKSEFPNVAAIAA